MNKIVIDDIKKIISGIPEEVRNMRKNIDSSAFWNFETEFQNEAVGYGGSTVKQEAIALLNMCANAVARYDIVMRNCEKATFRFVESAIDRADKDFAAFVSAAQKAEMKGLWMNKICRQLTGKYFFTGKLNKTEDGQSFTVESVFSFAYLLFLLIDENGQEQ